MDEFFAILNEPDVEKRHAMLKERIDFFERDKEPVNIKPSDYYKRVYEGFLTSKDRLTYDTSNIVAGSYSLKDQDYLYQFVDFLVSSDLTKMENLTTIMFSISYFLRKYFGTPLNGENKVNREDYMYELTDNIMSSEEDDNKAWERVLEVLDIGLFKGTSMAECTEYCVLAQNILTLMGYRTLYCNGFCKLKDEGEYHGFNLIETPGKKYFLIDSTNPFPYFGKNDIVENVKTKLFPISSEDFEKALNKEDIEINATTYYFEKTDNGWKKVNNGDVVYSNQSSKNLTI